MKLGSRTKFGLSNNVMSNLVWTSSEVIDVVDCWFYANEILESTPIAPELIIIPNHIFIGKKQTIVAGVVWTSNYGPVSQESFVG